MLHDGGDLRQKTRLVPGWFGKTGGTRIERSEKVEQSTQNPDDWLPPDAKSSDQMLAGCVGVSAIVPFSACAWGVGEWEWVYGVLKMWLIEDRRHGDRRAGHRYVLEVDTL